MGVVLLYVGCTSEPTQRPTDLTGDWEGIEEAADGLTDLSGRCSFAASTLTCTLVANDILMLSKSPEANVVVNGFKVTTGNVTATAANTKKILVTGSSGTDRVILDFMGGTFAMGAASDPSGIVVDLVSGSNDALKIRGSNSAETYVYGSSGISINGDGFKDITYANVDDHVVSLIDGNDTFSGAGNAATGGVIAHGVTVFGGAGADTLRGGAGADTLFGGDGNDTFSTGSVADGGDTMNGGANTDTADYSNRTSALVITLSSTGGEPGENDVLASDVEVLKGGMGNDTLVGDGNANTISGGPGNDTIDGKLGSDVLNGDAGNDTFIESGTVASGADTFNGGPGTDLVTYASRTAAVTLHMEDSIANDGEAGEADKIAVDVENATTGSGADSITGSSAANVLDGGSGNDTITGGAGNDTLIGGLGDDVLTGGEGDDTFDEGTATNGADAMTGGNGVDLVDYADRTVGVTVTIDGANNDGQTGGAEGDNVKTDIENVTGSSTAVNSLTGSNAANLLIGGSGNDVLVGGLGNDTLLGGAGDDNLNGGADDDWLEGEAGDDTLTCSSGVDLAFFDATDTDPDGDGLCELVSIVPGGAPPPPPPATTIASGTYAGNSTDDRAFTGLGFQPDIVMIRGSAPGIPAVIRTSTMAGGLAKDFSNSGFTADTIQSLDADGFTVGTSAGVNEFGRSYEFVAIKARSDIRVSTYVGNGVDDRNITGVGFQPVWVVALGSSFSSYRIGSLGGDAAYQIHAAGSAATDADLIQAFNGDGFQVGTLLNVSGEPYHFIAFGASASIAQSTFVGNGVDNRSIAVGFQPAFVWVKDPDTFMGVWRSSATVGDGAHQFQAFEEPVPEGVQALEANGFQAGSGGVANANAATMHFLAIKN